MRLRLLFRRLTVSAPRMAVRSALPWPFRWAVLALVFGFCVAIGLWAFQFGKEIAGLDYGTKEQLRQTRSELARVREQVATLQDASDKALSITNTADTLLISEKVTQDRLAAQHKQLATDNQSLRDDLGFFEKLIPAAGVAGIAAAVTGAAETYAADQASAAQEATINQQQATIDNLAQQVQAMQAQMQAQQAPATPAPATPAPTTPAQDPAPAQPGQDPGGGGGGGDFGDAPGGDGGGDFGDAPQGEQGGPAQAQQLPPDNGAGDLDNGDFGGGGGDVGAGGDFGGGGGGGDVGGGDVGGGEFAAGACRKTACSAKTKVCVCTHY